MVAQWLRKATDCGMQGLQFGNVSTRRIMFSNRPADHWWIYIFLLGTILSKSSLQPPTWSTLRNYFLLTPSTIRRPIVVSPSVPISLWFQLTLPSLFGHQASLLLVAEIYILQLDKHFMVTFLISVIQILTSFLGKVWQVPPKIRFYLTSFGLFKTKL